MTTTTAVPAQQEEDAENNHYESVYRRIAIYFGELLPTGKCSFEYMTEGAANVVWCVRFHDSNLDSYDNSVVLRMRKDIPSTISMLDLRQQYEERIAPLFLFNPSLLLPVQLIQLCPSLIEQLNNQLHSLEDMNHRGLLRIGAYHPDFSAEQYAMILPNLGHGQGKIIEFKPKWLTQSPSAPRDAQRCRTCALNARRRAKGGSGRGDSGFCPFDLLSRNDKILGNALSQIWVEATSLQEFVDAFRSKVQPALRQLQKLQRAHNEVGLNDFQNPTGKDFSVAMALRDCSIVLKTVPSPCEGMLEIPTIKLLDLDLKDAGGGKLGKWARMEAELVEEGWYTSKGSDVLCAMTFQ